MTVFTIILGLLPGLAWLLFYLREDLHPEPKRLIALTFVAGAVAAVAALLVEVFLNNRLEHIGVIELSPLSLIALSLVEEFFKFLAAYLVVRKHPAFNEPVDAMIYLVVAAMGFATIENIGALNFTEPAPGLSPGSPVEVAALRFVGATLLHALASGIVGYSWAVTIREFGARRFLLLGLAVATALHAFFNYLIITNDSIVGPILFVAIVGFFVLNDFEKLKRKAI